MFTLWIPILFTNYIIQYNSIYYINYIIQYKIIYYLYYSIYFVNSMGTHSIRTLVIYQYYVMYLAWWWFKETETYRRIFNTDYQYILLCYWLNKLLYLLLKVLFISLTGYVVNLQFLKTNSDSFNVCLWICALFLIYPAIKLPVHIRYKHRKPKSLWT